MNSINDVMDPHRKRLAEMSNDALLQYLRLFDPLPDETDSGWSIEPFPLFNRAGEFLVFADEVARRKLPAGIPLLLERACHGDPSEMMRGLRHSLEAAVDGDWRHLATACISQLSSARPGTRLWATNQLAILRDPTAVEALRSVLLDPEPLVREEAITAVRMLAQQHPEDANLLRDSILALEATDPDPSVRRQAARARETFISTGGMDALDQ